MSVEAGYFEKDYFNNGGEGITFTQRLRRALNPLSPEGKWPWVIGLGAVAVLSPLHFSERALAGVTALLLAMRKGEIKRGRERFG